jgi:hypothetical protein
LLYDPAEVVLFEQVNDASPERTVIHF